jgi:membrane protease YdiL (CAAX protease family)
MKTLTKSQVITYIIFFMLLISRISLSIINFIASTFSNTGAVPAWSNWLNAIGPWINVFYTFGAFPLIAIVILLNQDDLQSLNIDKFFIFIFICSGFATSAEYILGLGCLTGILPLLFSIYALSDNGMKFSNTNPNVWRMSLIIISLFVVCFIAVNSSLNMSKVEQTMSSSFFHIIAGSVSEEAIYRGLLWMFLKNLKWSESKVFFFQAFIFWISHIDYLLESPFSFWIFIPLLGLLLGYIVLRSKSITPSALAHILINLLVVFV